MMSDRETVMSASRSEYNRKWYAKNRGRRSAYNREYQQKNRERLLQKKKERYLAQRQEAISLYGGECVMCGESDFTALQFDHIVGDGGVHRNRLPGSGSGVHMVDALRRDGWPDYVQLLCANCHKKKSAVEAGERLLSSCRKGHPFTPENTNLNKQGNRICRACNRIRMLRFSRNQAIRGL